MKCNPICTQAILNIHIKLWECPYCIWDIWAWGIFSIIKQSGGWFQTSQVGHPKIPSLKQQLSDALLSSAATTTANELFSSSPPKTEWDFHQSSGDKFLGPFCRDLHYEVLAAINAESADWSRSCLFRPFPGGYPLCFRMSQYDVLSFLNCCKLQSSLLKDPEISNGLIKLMVNCCCSRGALWAVLFRRETGEQHILYLYSGILIYTTSVMLTRSLNSAAKMPHKYNHHSHRKKHS